MKHAELKCASLTKCGNVVPSFKKMNSLMIKPLQSDDNYRSLGQDEDVRYDGSIN